MDRPLRNNFFDISDMINMFYFAKQNGDIESPSLVKLNLKARKVLLKCLSGCLISS